MPGLWAKTVTMAVLGVGVGMFFTSYCLVVVEVLGLPLLTPMLSISGVFKGTFVIVFGPFVGECYSFQDPVHVERNQGSDYLS